MDRKESDLRFVKKKSIGSRHQTLAHILGKTVYFSDKSPKWTIQHEIGHYMSGHNTRYIDVGPEEYAYQEIEASLYAYNKIRQPIHLLSILKGISKDLNWREYNVNQQLSLRYIKKALYKLHAPQSWKDDFNRLTAEVSIQDRKD